MLYNITTYGCYMNVHESEKIAGVLEEIGYKETDSKQDADVLVFNTCAIREGAENRAFGNVGALKQMKRDNPNKIVAVVGCMTQQKDVAEKIYKMFPFVDIVLGTHNIHSLKDAVLSVQKNRKRLSANAEQGDVVENSPIYRTSGDNAWVNIMYGCDNFCTYCIVPYVRGREKSREKSKILNEIKELVACGHYKKITLLGQNVNSYGNNTNEGTFAELLADICKIDGDFELTFMTSHPKDLTDDVIDVMASESKIVKDLHLPVQSGSNKILKLMNRKYTREHYLELVSKIRNKIPNIRLTTDIIVGFPFETDEDFKDTMSLIEEVKYNGIFAFMYSKRSGTAAEKFDEQIPENVKTYRVNALLNKEKEIQKQNKKG